MYAQPCTCVHICVCVAVYVCSYMCMCHHMCVHVGMQKCMCPCVCVCMYTHLGVCNHMWFFSWLLWPDHSGCKYSREQPAEARAIRIRLKGLEEAGDEHWWESRGFPDGVTSAFQEKKPCPTFSHPQEVEYWPDNHILGGRVGLIFQRMELGALRKLVLRNGSLSMATLFLM